MSYRYGPSVFCIKPQSKNEEKCAKTRICELWHTLLFFPHAISMRRMIRILR